MSIHRKKSLKIVIVTYGGGHVSMMAPVAIAMKKLGYQVLYLALTSAGSYLSRLGIDSIGYRDLPGADAVNVQAWGKVLAAELSNNNHLVPTEESIAYLGLNYVELIKSFGEVKAAEHFKLNGRQAFLPIRLIESWLKDVVPDLVLATNSPRSERAAIIAAGRLGIKSVCAVDLFGLQEVKWIGEHGYADRVCVLNESVRDFFIRHGRKPHEVLVTGNPSFEILLNQNSIISGKLLRQKRGWVDKKLTILWASQVEPKNHPFTQKEGDPFLPREIENVLRNFVNKNQDFRLVIRYHPSEQVEFNDNQQNVYYSSNNENIAELLHAVDVVVVMTSTVGLEANYAGRPVISVDASVFTEDAPYSQMGISWGVSDPKDLPLKLLQLTKQIREHNKQDHIKETSHSPTKKIIEVINSLAI